MNMRNPSSDKASDLEVAGVSLPRMNATKRSTSPEPPSGVAAGSSIIARLHIELEPADNQCRAKGTRAERKLSIGGKESGEKRETAIYAGAGWSRADGQRIDTPR